MLSEQEMLQICRRYEIKCPICETLNEFYRLKTDMVRASKTEGDGHPLTYRWGKPGFESVDPLQFFWGVCKKCSYTGELEDAEFRQAERAIDEYRALFKADGLRKLLTAVATGKGLSQSLGKLSGEEDPLTNALARFHLGIFCQSLRERIIPGNFARFYLRIAWLYRHQPTYYAGSDPQQVADKLNHLKKSWLKELPVHPDYPTRPLPALNETDGLRMSLAFFERNYETLREAKLEDELRLRQLMAEIGYRLFELTGAEEDFKKASTAFSGAMQKCLSIINDKSIVGGVVNRAKGMLDEVGERGRELRELHKSKEGDATGGGPPAEESGKKVGKAAKVPAKAVKTSPKENESAEKEAEKAAPVAAPEAPSANGQADLDQATRRVNLLEEEMGTLKERLKELEEDNKKWRQLAGRDMVTGLPNKTMLFRLIIPKILRSLKQTGPVSCIAISLDQVAQINQGYGWLMGDRMLRESARNLRHFIAEGEELYRLDGVNFVVVGAMSNNVARQRAMEMKRRLAQASVQVDKTQFPLVSSLGVVTVERAIGGTAAEVSKGILDALLSTLYKAKEKGGNSVEVNPMTRF